MNYAMTCDGTWNKAYAEFFPFPFDVSCVSSRKIVKNNKESATEFRLPVLEPDTNTEPVVMMDIRCKKRIFRFQTRLELQPSYDETGQLLCLKHDPIGIHVFAETRQELLTELAEQICMLWDEYACEDNKNLTPAAIQLKNKLRGVLKEI